MTLEAFFSLTPQQPMIKRLPVDDGPAVNAFVNFWNMAALAWGGAGGTTPTLERQLTEGWVYLSGGTAAPYDEDANNVICNRERSQIVEIGFQGINVTDRNQFLAVVGLHAAAFLFAARRHHAATCPSCSATRCCTWSTRF